MHHCGKIRPALSRRQMLREAANGFGMLALGGILAQESLAGDRGTQNGLGGKSRNPLSAKEGHWTGTARSVIFLYMDGGPSQVDTFDYKPLLQKYHGRNPREVIGELQPTQFDNVGSVLQSPWKFAQHGASGAWVSELFPFVAQVVDELALIHSMTSKFSEHTNANYFLHTGSGLQGRPSMGAWAGYGLGSENENLPAFVVLNGGLIPPGGLDNFNSGFLPATYQGSILRPQDIPVANIVPSEPLPGVQRGKLDLIHSLDRSSQSQFGVEEGVESAIANYELAARMQLAVPELVDLSQESAATTKLYGLDAEMPNTQIFGRQCLMARRLVERGVRFIELTCPDGNGDRWDQHGGLQDGHTKNSRTVDQPIAGLIADLKARGLLDSTLVVWGGEFGRTPFAQGSDGRDHNPSAFTMWMCGGGVKGGVTYGASDEWGYKAIENRLEMHDLHATILHLMGIDHERLTFYYGGRQMRLTDVHGHVIHDLLRT